MYITLSFAYQSSALLSAPGWKPHQTVIFKALLLQANRHAPAGTLIVKMAVPIGLQPT